VWRAYGTVVVVLTVLLLGASQVYADCSTTQQLPSDLLCAKYVDYAIPGDWLEQDIRGKDNLVKNAAHTCRYYQLAEFNCRKLFYKCEDGKTEPLKLCLSTCLAGYHWDDGTSTCSRRVEFSSIQNECSNSNDFSSDPNECYDHAIPEPKKSTQWRWLLFGILIGIGAAILFTLLYQWCRAKRISPELTDADVNRVFEHERKAMEKGTWTGPLPPVNSTMTPEEIAQAAESREKRQQAIAEAEARERARQEEHRRQMVQARNQGAAESQVDNVEMQPLHRQGHPL